MRFTLPLAICVAAVALGGCRDKRAPSITDEARTSATQAARAPDEPLPPPQPTATTVAAAPETATSTTEASPRGTVAARTAPAQPRTIAEPRQEDRASEERTNAPADTGYFRVPPLPTATATGTETATPVPSDTGTANATAPTSRGNQGNQGSSPNPATAPDDGGAPGVMGGSDTDAGTVSGAPAPSTSGFSPELFDASPLGR